MTKEIWTDAREALLLKLWQAGVSARDIAEKIGAGLTRNAVLGKVHRLRKNRNVKDPKKREATKPPKALRSGANYEPSKSKVRAKDVKPKQNHWDDLTPDTPGLILIETIRRDQCQWPLNNALHGVYYFCGAKREPRRPYCKEHCEISYVKQENKNAL